MRPFDYAKTTVEAPLPYLISWNITKRCNLKCAHCYLDASELEGRGETSTEEAKRVIAEIASLNPSSMLILTGGEPLLRPDCFELAAEASSKGLMVVIGTNGTLLDDNIAAKLIDGGVKGVGISLDSTTPSYHDRFRGVEGAWNKTVFGIEALKRRAVPFQLQLTVTKENREDIPRIIEFAREKGAKAINIFFLVCTGRGQDMTDLSPQEYEETMTCLASAEKEFEDRIMVRARCAPHFLRVVAGLNPESGIVKGHTSGCIAGSGYLRITPDNEVTPCPYMPATGASLRTKSLKDIWNNEPAFRALRTRDYSGKCRDCEFSGACGGCRARALSSGNTLMGEDPWCVYEPAGKKQNVVMKGLPASAGTEWTKEAQERLSAVPAFLRQMVKNGVEKYAASKGLKTITPDIMAEIKKRASR
ncbi:MAG: radical SAM protein [Deltaproteobacteria bacterium]|nr:radical SAM protein [Deltaproteobacteria bacterium]